MNRTILECKFFDYIYISLICFIWIEPYWNVNKKNSFDSFDQRTNLNRTILECKLHSLWSFYVPRFNLNRTILECKWSQIFNTFCWCRNLNRTILECKYSKTCDVLQIHTIWIEPYWNVNKINSVIKIAKALNLNRTILECKYKNRILYKSTHTNLNRTILECKW